MIVYSVNRCHGGFVGVTKEIGFARYVYFVEGAAFVVIAFFASGKWGFPGVILCAIVVDILLPGFYGLWRSKRFFGSPYDEMTIGWLKEPILYAIIFLPLSVGLAILVGNLGIYSLVMRGGLLALSGIPLLWFLGIPAELRLEISTKIRAFFMRKGISPAHKTPTGVKN